MPTLREQYGELFGEKKKPTLKDMYGDYLKPKQDIQPITSSANTNMPTQPDYGIPTALPPGTTEADFMPAMEYPPDAPINQPAQPEPQLPDYINEMEALTAKIAEPQPKRVLGDKKDIDFSQLVIPDVPLQPAPVDNAKGFGGGTPTDFGTHFSRGSEDMMLGLDQMFGVGKSPYDDSPMTPEQASFERMSPTSQVASTALRGTGRAAVGAISFIPVLYEKVLNTLAGQGKEGKSKLDSNTQALFDEITLIGEPLKRLAETGIIIGEEGENLMKMVLDVPAQMQFVIAKAAGKKDPLKNFNKNDPLVKMMEGITGKPFEEYYKNAINTLYSAPESLPFGASMGLHGAKAIAKRGAAPTLAEQAKGAESTPYVPESYQTKASDNIMLDKRLDESLKRPDTKKTIKLEPDKQPTDVSTPATDKVTKPQKPPNMQIGAENIQNSQLTPQKTATPPLSPPKTGKYDGTMEKYGTRNQYYENNPYRKQLDIMKETKQFDRDILKKSEEWELSQVLQDKPSFISEGYIPKEELIDFAKKNNLVFSDKKVGQFIIAKDNTALENLLNAKGGREVGLALGYKDITKTEPPKTEQVSKAKEPWEMTKQEHFHPQFTRSGLEKFEKAGNGEIVGTIGDFIQGEKTRKILEPVLNIPVMKLDRPVQKGKVVKPGEGIVFKGGSGKYKGKPAIFIKETPDMYTTLIEEAAHQMRVAKGRSMTKQDITTMKFDEYLKEPEEMSAKKMVDYLQEVGRNELTHKEIIQQALSEGKPVPKEVLADYPELAKSPAVETEPIIKGKEVSDYLKEIGTDEGVSDYLLSEIKERNYKLKELSIDDILKQDETTRNNVLSGEIRNEGDYYHKDVYNPIIVHLKDGKYDVVDGYNRLTQLYKDGEKSVDAYLEVGKKIKKNKDIVTVEGTAGKGSPNAKATNNITSDKQKPKSPAVEASNKQFIEKHNWFRGEDARNKDGDLFFSVDESVAGDYGKVRPIDKSEYPQNPLFVDGSKSDIVDLVGYNEKKHGTPFAQHKGVPENQQFDYLAKKYAQEKGHDGIVYTDGTGDVAEMVKFKSPAVEGVVDFKELNDKGVLPSDAIRIAYIKDKSKYVKDDITTQSLKNADDMVQVKKVGDKLEYNEYYCKACWDALYKKPGYKGLTKSDAIDKFVSERFPVIAKESGYVVDGYVFKNNKLKVDMSPAVEKPADKAPVVDVKATEAVKDWTDIKDLDAQVRKIKPPNKDFDKWTVDVGVQESLGESGGDIVTLFYKDKPTLEDIKSDILDYYKEQKIRINKEVVPGIKAKSGRDESIEGAIDKVIKPEPPVADTPKEAVREIVEGKRESTIGTAEFKKRMMKELDDALKTAKNRPRELSRVREDAESIISNESGGYSQTALEARKAKRRELETTIDAIKKEHGIKDITIQIPGDGEFKIEHTVEAIDAVRKKVRGLQLDGKEKVKTTSSGAGKGESLQEGLESGTVDFVPEKGQSGRKYELSISEDAIYKEVPIPEKPKIKYPQEIFYFDGDSPFGSNAKIRAGEKYITNGHFIIDKKFLDEKTLDIMYKPRNLSETRVYKDEMIQRVENHNTIGKAKVSDVFAEEVGRVIDKDNLNETVQTIYSDGKYKAGFDAAYIDFLSRKIKDFRIQLATSSNSASRIYSGNELAGYIMPMKFKNPGDISVKTVKPSKDVFTRMKERESGGGSSGTKGMPFDSSMPAKVEASGKGTSYDRMRESTPAEKVSESNKVTSRQEAVDHFRRAFKIPIRTGKFRHRAAGIYKPRAEVIRTRDANELNVISHELGHHLDKKYYGGKIRDFLNSESRKELLAAGKELYGKRKPAGGYQSEGLAEYVATWLISDRAAEIFPAFDKQFKELLKNNPDLNANMSKGRELIRKWREQGAVDRVYANIDFGRTISKNVKDLTNWDITKERLTKGKLTLQSKFTDELAPLEYVEKKIRGVNKLDPKKIDPITSPTMIARAVAMTAGAKARSMVIDGTFDFGGRTTGISLREALTPVGKDMKNFIAYIYAVRGKELWKRGINPGISRVDANYVAGKLKSKLFDDAFEQLRGFENRIVDYLVDAGGMSEQAAQAMMEMNPFHIPLKRSFDAYLDANKIQGGVGKRFGDLFSPIKKIRGSGRMIIDPIESIIANTATIINYADKVRVGRALINLAHKEGAGWAMEKLPQPMAAKKFTIEKIWEQLDEAGVDLADANLKEILTIYENAGLYRGKDNIISFIENGERVHYQVNENLYATLKGLDAPSLPPIADFFLGRPARAIRLGATGLNAGFGLITNPMRDAFTFALQTEYVKSAGLPYVNEFLKLGKGLGKAVLPAGEMKTLFRRSGADMSQFLGLDRKTLQRSVGDALASTPTRRALNIVWHPVEAMKDVFSVTEAAPRLAEFEAAFKDGIKRYGKQESATVMANLAASEVTVNFRRAGAYGKWLNRMIPFWNASIQGTSRFYRFAKEHPGKAMVKGITHVTLPTLGMWYMNKDKDWYREMPAWQRYGFWNIESGTNKDGTPRIVRIPRPFDWANVFASTPEMVMDYWYSKDKSVANDGLYYLAENYNPIDAPPIVKIPLQLAANYDLFRERPIDPYFEIKYKDPQDRFSTYTTETSKFLGKQFGLSPRKIDWLVKSSTGGLGLEGIRTFEATMSKEEREDEIKNFANLPVVGRLFQRVEEPEKIEQRKEYEISDKYQKIVNAYMAGREKEATERLLYLHRQYSKYPKLLEKLPKTGQELRDVAAKRIEAKELKNEGQ